MKRASADVGLMFVAFNLRRLMNIIDKNEFKKFIQELAFLFLTKWTSLKAKLLAVSVLFLPKHQLQLFKTSGLNCS